MLILRLSMTGMAIIWLKTIRYIFNVFSLALVITALLPVSNVLGAPPKVTTDAATDITATSATLNGKISDDSSASVSFEWGITTGYGHTTAVQTVGKKGKGDFSAIITNLSPNTVYHFRAKVVNDGTSYGSDRLFTTSSVPLAVVTGTASNITSSGATVSGNLISKGIAGSVKVSFEYGTTTSYGRTVEGMPLTLTNTGAFTANLPGLSPNTIYHFRAKAVNNGTSYGSDGSFTTSSIPAATPLTVVTGTASNITSSGATVGGNLVAKGIAGSVSVSFEYGTTTSYGRTAEGVPPTLSNTGAFTANLPGLSPNTIYHFRAKAVNNGTSYGSDGSFTTSSIPAATPLTVVTGAASNITSSGATVGGNLVAKGIAGSVSVSFEYGTTTSYGRTVEGVPPTLTNTGAFTANLPGLSPNTIYHFRAKAVNNGTSYGSDGSFTTSSIPAATPLTVVTGTASNITSSGATVGGNLVAKGIAGSVSVSFEYGTTTSYGRTVEGVPPTLTNTGAFTANLPGLSPNTIYHFRAKAVGATTNYGSDATFTTLTTPPPGGGGGGAYINDVGGGAGDPKPEANTVTVTGLIPSSSLMIDNGGVVLDNVKLKTADDYVSINIERGTTLLDINGQPIKSLTASSLPSPPLPPQTSALLFSYDFGPSGVHLITSITLSYKYDTRILPAGVDINSLYIAFWDGQHWQKFDTKIDVNSNTVSTLITEFGQYALMAKFPASFSFTTFGITPPLAQVGDVVNIAVTCTNLGGSAGNYPVILKLNNVEEDRKVITLNPGASQVVLFRVTKSIGTYAVDINGLVSEFVVQPALLLPASLTFTTFGIIPPLAQVGDVVNIAVTCTNVGGSQGNYTVILKLNNVEEDRKVITLNPGASQVALFRVTKSIGTYAVDINGLVSEFVVQPALSFPASFSFTKFGITPPLAQVGDVVDIAVTCTNLGGSPGNFPVILKLNNVEEGRKVITLNPGASQVALFRVTKSIGTYAVDINGLASEFVVQPALSLPASFSFTKFGITPPLAQVGGVVDIAVTCTNVGGSPGNYPVILKLNNVEEDRKVITLNPGASQVALFRVTKSIGTYAVDINGLVSEFVVQPAPEATPIHPPFELIIIIVGFALLIVFALVVKS